MPETKQRNGIRVFHGFDALPRFVRPAVTVGSYDGVHRGHRALIERLVAEARAEAEEIVKKAEAKAEDVSKNTMTEISLAGKQAVGRIKSEIASLIIAKATARGVKEAVVDPAFIKEMLVAVAKNWNGADSGKVELQALLPEAEFFRANRQFIVARRAVKEIAVWFGSRLSLSLVLETPERIVISKARVPEFKAWLTSVQPAE